MFARSSKISRDQNMGKIEISAESTTYGELVLIGLHSANALPFSCKYILKQRSHPNGLRPGQTYRFHHIGDGNLECDSVAVEIQERGLDETLANETPLPPVEDAQQGLMKARSHATCPVTVLPHSSNSMNNYTQPPAHGSTIHFTLSKQETIVTNYDEDDKTDLFQIGRADSKKIDFRVDTPHPQPDGTSTVSRFAFRILVDRKKPYTARLFAAGFDEANRIVLGENAKKWQNQDGKYDGLVTNGLLMMKPCEKPTKWREVSVSGRVFPVRGQRWIPSKDQEICKEDNILVDGTLIDICGATLLWRSRQGLAKSADIEQLHRNIALLNKRHIICPVQLRTLIIRPQKVKSLKEQLSMASQMEPKPMASSNGILENDPYCYLACGHVASASLLQWGQRGSNDEHQCPLCRRIGPLVKLQLGLEPSFYVDKELPTWAFKPCGHSASEQTVKYWSKIAVPFGAFGFRIICPFCALPLDDQNPFVKLIFEED